MSIDVTALRQSWPRPAAPKPIVIIGAGGIVDDAHLPAYRLADFPIAGVFDLNPERAKTVAGKWGIPAFATLEDAIATPNSVYDLALPPGAHLDVLPKLPDGAAVLLQKPMGRDLAEANAYGLAPSIAFGLGTDTRAFFSYERLDRDDRPDWGVPGATVKGFYLYNSEAGRASRDSFFSAPSSSSRSGTCVILSV